jgi:hypothetical protein
MKLSYSEVQNIMYGANSIEELRLNLFKHFEVENNPKALLCFSQSWKAQEGKGFYSIVLDFGERVKLIKD